MGNLTVASETDARPLKATPAKMTPVAWRPGEEMQFSQWVEHGRRLGLMGRNTGWWIGDWLNFGNKAYGERYVRAATITGYDVQTLMNMCYVASHVPVSRRREKLSWSHHAELAALPDDEQERCLDLAEAEHLSVRDLREELRRGRRALNAARKEAADVDGGAGVRAADADKFVCPECGHSFESDRAELAMSLT